MWIWLYEQEEKYRNKHTDPTLLSVVKAEEEAMQTKKNQRLLKIYKEFQYFVVGGGVGVGMQGHQDDMWKKTKTQA